MKKQLWIAIALLALIPGLLAAQAKPSTKIEAKLVFFDDDTQVVITDAKGVSVTPTEGLSLQPGWVVKTKKSTVEIKLQPNGSIFKLTSNSAFRIDGLKDLDNANSSDFALLNGKVRAVAAKLTGLTAPGYNLRTPTSNCGVRGTDFAVMFDPSNKKDWVCVQEGLVDFTNSVTGQTVQVATNQFANTFDAVFQSAPVSSDRLSQLFSDLNFQKLNPGEVPGHVVSDKAPASSPAPTASTAPSETKPESTAANSGDDSLAWLKNLIGLEIGAVTINGTTYSKAVVSPVIALGNMKLGLYLPVIYSNDLFNANDWYKPAGNNEWSFGSDSSYGSDWIGRTGDFATDVLLKIKFLEYGNPGFDPFYIKLGNLKSMGLGHGTIVRDFANDQEFPSVRKIGFNTGFKSGPFTAEALVDDLSSPKVLGGRLAFDLVPDQFIFGFSTVADLFPITSKGLFSNPSAGTTDPTALGDPSLLVGGLDFQLFKINTPVFSTIAFADLNTITAAYRNSITGSSVAPGLATQTIFDNGFKSYGGEAGVYGNILIAQYRLSFQYEKGLYSNGLFSSNYYRNQLSTALSINSYLTNSATRDQIDNVLKLGIYGSAGFNLFNMFVFEAGYRLPMSQDSTGIHFAGDDYLKLKLELLKDKLPLIKASGSISYERTGFVTGIRDGINLFDAKTMLKGEVVYGLVKGIDLVANVATNVVVDANGNVVYQGSLPKVTPSVSLETRVSF